MVREEPDRRYSLVGECYMVGITFDEAVKKDEHGGRKESRNLRWRKRFS